MRFYLSLLIGFCTLFSFAASDVKTVNLKEAIKVKKEIKLSDKKVGKEMLVIETQYGAIEIELFPEDAPKTVAQITKYAKEKKYDDLTFHRVIPNFVAQGGDPKGNGTGGFGNNLVAEFNKRKHVEGTLAMARSSDPNSADSQFYIALGTLPHLDNQYTIFGQVKTGIEAVRKIKVGDKMIKVSVKEG